LQPRMPGYETGALDAASGDFRFNIFNTDNLAKPLQVKTLLITQLPRVAPSRRCSRRQAGVLARSADSALERFARSAPDGKATARQQLP